MWLLARWWITAAGIIAVLAFLQAGIEKEVTMQDGLVALCVATVFLIEAIRERRGLMLFWWRRRHCWFLFVACQWH